MSDDKVEVIRRYSQGVDRPDYHRLLSDAALMAVECEAERALADEAAHILNSFTADPQVERWLARYRKAREQ